MRKKRTIEDEINSFLETWDCKQQIAFLRDIIPLFELYDVEDEDDWVKDKVGGDDENVRNVRLIRTVYLVSRICAFHAGKMVAINCAFKDLWKKMEKHGAETKDELKVIEEKIETAFPGILANWIEFKSEDEKRA